MSRLRAYLVVPVLLTGMLVVILALVPALALASGGSFIGGLHHISTVASTVPR